MCIWQIPGNWIPYLFVCCSCSTLYKLLFCSLLANESICVAVICCVCVCEGWIRAVIRISLQFGSAVKSNKLSATPVTYRTLNHEHTHTNGSVAPVHSETNTHTHGVIIGPITVWTPAYFVSRVAKCCLRCFDSKASSCSVYQRLWALVLWKRCTVTSLLKNIRSTTCTTVQG